MRIPINNINHFTILGDPHKKTIIEFKTNSQKQNFIYLSLDAYENLMTLIPEKEINLVRKKRE